MRGMDSYRFNNTEGAKQLKKKLMEQYEELFECPNGGDVKICDCALRGDNKCAEDCNACKLWLLLADLLRDNEQLNEIKEVSVKYIMDFHRDTSSAILQLENYPAAEEYMDLLTRYEDRDDYNEEDYPDLEEDDMDDAYDDLDADDISGLIEEE